MELLDHPEAGGKRSIIFPRRLTARASGAAGEDAVVARVMDRGHGRAVFLGEAAFIAVIRAVAGGDRRVIECSSGP
jgi:hypothetical protein